VPPATKLEVLGHAFGLGWVSEPPWREGAVDCPAWDKSVENLAMCGFDG